MTFEEDLAAQSEEPLASTLVEITLNKKLYRLRVKALDPFDWADETDRHPLRPEAIIDLRYGFNLRSLTYAVIPRCVFLVESDQERALPKAQWDVLLRSGGGKALRTIGDAIFQLNVYDPEQEIVAAKKELADSERTSA